MYILSDVERMGTLSVEVAKCVREKVDNRYKYTPEAMDELQKSLKTLEKMFNDSLKALQGDESVQIEKLIKRKDKIMDLDLKMRKAHVQRVNKGKCKSKPDSTIYKYPASDRPYGKQLCQPCGCCVK